MPTASHEGPRARPTSAPSTLSLPARIRERIEKRLGERIRDLNVAISGEKIVLEGRCATYYLKQLAQHAALGVIEDENLENEIKVVTCR